MSRGSQCSRGPRLPPPRPSQQNVEAELEEAMPLMKKMETAIRGN